MNQIMEVEKGDYTISNNKNRLQIQVIHSFLSTQSYWAEDIPLALVQKSIDNSLCFGIYYKGVQVGFARLITDKATFAYLADVFIVELHRAKGLSKWLMEYIQNYPEVQGLRRWMLATKDAHNLYSQFGWEKLTDETADKIMLKLSTNIYKNNR